MQATIELLPAYPGHAAQSAAFTAAGVLAERVEFPAMVDGAPVMVEAVQVTMGSGDVRRGRLTVPLGMKTGITPLFLAGMLVVAEA